MTEHFHVFSKEQEDKDIEHYDVCIIGGGPAGLSAALYASRYGMHTALISKDIGGMANYAHKIENYPGFEGSGLELMKKFFQQAEKHGTEFLMTTILDLEKDKTGFIVKLSNEKVVHSRTLIIALGTEKRKLMIKGEEKFLGKGISYCATCDANFFKDKEVIVIGGSDSAAKTSILLSGIAKKVYLSYRKDCVRCEQVLTENVKKRKNIEIILNSVPLEIKGNNQVKSIVLDVAGSKKEIKVDGVFVEIGSVPLTAIVKKLGIKTENDYVIVDENMATNIAGVFAAGDAVKSRMKQIIVAASQGAISAKSAYDFLKR